MGLLSAAMDGQGTSERESVEAALRASEERYRRLVESSPEAVAVHRQGTLLYVNPAGAALVGAAGPEDLLGRSIFDFVHPDYRAVVAQRVRQVQAESSPAAVIQERFLRLDGHPVDVEVVAIPIAYAGDAASLVVIRDVTARTEAEAAVAESRDQLDVILRGVADGITAQAPDGRLVYANDAAARLLGFASAQALLSTPVAEVMGGFVVLDERGNVVPLDSLPQRRALAGERPEPAWVRFRVVATGEEHWSLLSSAPVFDDTGHVRLAISIFRDLTERKRAEERLRFLADAGAQLPSSLDVVGTLRSVAQMAVHTLADWSVAYLATFAPTIDEQAGAPGAATAALGVELVAVAHRDANKLALAEELQQRYPPGPDEPAMLWQVMRTGEPVFLPAVSEELLARAAHDPAHLVLLQALQIRSAIWVPLVARGRTLGAIGLFGAESGRQYTADDVALAEEIARRAALAVDNARLYREAQEAIRARDEFLSIAAHELRTPVTALKGTADLLARMHARGTLDEARLEQFLGLLRDSGNRLATLVEDLLDVSRLQTGQLALRLRPIDVGPFVV